ncbi:MAG: alcohol dehydrogenase [Pseudomonadota bacterium]
MKSYALVEYGKPLEVIEREDPTPEGKEVVVRVRRCGVCHSDVHIWEGYFDMGEGQKFRMSDRGMKLPHTLGHEILGEVVAAGPDAKDAPIGKTMLVHPWIGCGHCEACAEERENDCTAMRALGVVQPGGFATHVVVPDPKFLVDIGDLDPSVAAPYACSGVTVYTALKKLLPIRDDEWLAVIGAGGLGLAAVSIAKAMGFPNVISVDLGQEKLAAAMDMGADETIDVREEENALEALRAKSHGKLMSVLDTVGSEDTSRLGFDGLTKTGRYVIVGLHGGTFKAPLPKLPQMALTVRGSYVGSSRDLKELMEMVRAGKVKSVPITERPMEKAYDTILDLAEGNVVGRVVLTAE